MVAIFLFTIDCLCVTCPPKMSSTLPPSGCGCPPKCPDPLVENIPGPTGPPGENAFGETSPTTGFTMPAVGNLAIVHFVVGTIDWAIVNQTVYISTAGYFLVNTLNGPNEMLLQNLGYAGNASPGTVIGTSLKISPAGPQGATGTLNSISPTTTKGDLIVDSGANNPAAADIRLAVGTNGKVLTAKSGVTAGMEWDVVDLTGAATSLSGQLPIGNGGTGKSTQQAALNNLMPPTPNLGGLAYFNGTNWVELDLTQNLIGQVLQTTGASPNTTIIWSWPALIQQQKATLQTYQNAASGIVLTGTTGAPTTGTGFLALTVTVTPKVSTSRLVVRASMCLFTSSSGAYVAIFNGTTLLAAALTTAASQAQQLTANYEFAPGSTSAITFNVYVGTGNSGTTYINGNATAIYFTGHVESLLTVEEYA